MKEIGGYFEFELNHGAHFHADAHRFNCARSALRCLIEARQIKHLYLPYYLCDSVVDACSQHGIRLERYYINPDFTPCLDGIPEDAFVLVVNYYGLLEPKQLLALSERFRHLIIDNTQAFFALPVPNVDTIYSCRKFFGVPDGGYLYTNIDLTMDYAQDTAANHMQHILGRFEASAESFYNAYLDNEARLGSCGIRTMSVLSDNLLRGIDYDNAKKMREANYGILSQRLGQYNLLSAEMPCGPFAYPFLTNDAPDIRRELIRQKIFIPQYWKEVINCSETDSIEHRYASDILPLPIDQRYSSDDMNYMCDILLKLLNL